METVLKIALMSRWNAACGTSLYGELIGRELMRRGYDLSILAPFNDDKLTVESDEEEVERCYTIYRFGWKEVEKELDPRPFLNLDYNIFMAQGFGFLTCMEQFRQIYPKIKEKAKTIYVVHERTPSSSPFAELDWDVLICFDERYKEVVSEVFGEERCKIIPYPYHPVVKGEMKEARERLNLPQDKRIIFTFGWRIEDYLPLLPIIEEVNEEFPLRYLVVADPRVATRLDEMAANPVYQSDEMLSYLPLAHIYENLISLFQAIWSGGTVNFVESIDTLAQCLGSLTPIVTTATRYVEMLTNEVIKYSSPYELKDKLNRIFENSDFGKRTIQEAERRVKDDSAEKTVEKYVKLFDSLLAE